MHDSFNKASQSQPNWSDWRWHMANRIRTVEQLRNWIDVSDTEAQAIEQNKQSYKFSVTPYYASLMDKSDPNCPIRRQAIPSHDELAVHPGADVDPVGDTRYRKTNRVIHKYPDRVVLMVTETCPVYCRHCTRKFHTTSKNGTYFREREALSFEEDFQYIANTPSIRDVLLTGGDPLVYSDSKLEAIISRLRSIPHVEIIRIGSRFPVLLPQRITEEFCSMLENYHPLWLNTHFNHPSEITPQAAEACDRLLRHGIPVQNQSVLLKGINDDLATMRRLLCELLKIRVRPYYLYHCDNVVGVSHFLTSIEAGKALMDGMYGNISGFSLPSYIITTHLGKIPITKEYVRRQDDHYFLEGYQGHTMIYEEPIIPTSHEVCEQKIIKSHTTT
ncbi:MAG: arginine 2,3-aminomutase [Candidatus Thiodiazotropha sp.]